MKLPDSFDNSLIGVKVQKPLQFWRDAGVRLPDGKTLPTLTTDLVSIIQPGGEGYKAYAVYGNYRVIIKWNASSYFATAVVHLADQLKS